MISVMIMSGLMMYVIVRLVTMFDVIIILLILLAVAGVKIVSQAKAVVVERLGSYDRTLETGPHYVIPVIERVANVVSLKEIVKDFAPQPVITKDNVTISINALLYFQIIDLPIQLYFEICCYFTAL